MKVITKIEKTSPFPWSHVVDPTGRIIVMDSRGAEVPLFTLLELAIGVTREHPSTAAVESGSL